MQNYTCDCGHVKQTLDVLSLKFHETRCHVATTPKERFESSFRLDHMYTYDGFYESAPNEITKEKPNEFPAKQTTIPNKQQSGGIISRCLRRRGGVALEQE